MLFRIFLTTALMLAQDAPDNLPAPKKISLTLAAAPLKAAAERLAKAGGIAIGLGECDPMAKVSIKVDKVPFVLALDSLCRSAKAGYRWTDGGVELINEPRVVSSTAVAQLGPFTMRTWIGARYKDTPALWIDTDWEPAVGARWYRIRIDSILGEDDMEIARSREAAGRMFYDEPTNNEKIMALTRGTGEWKRDFFAIKSLPEKAQIKSVAGVLKVGFPVGKKKTVRFSPPVNKQKVKVDEFPFSLEFFEYDNTKQVWRGAVYWEIGDVPLEKRIPLYGLFAGHRMRFYGKGGALANLSLGGGGTGGAGDDLRDVHIKGYCKVPDGSPLSAVEADFYSDVVIKDFPFEIKNVPVVSTKE